MHSIWPFFIERYFKLSSVSAMVAIVSIMIVVAVLLTVSTVVMAAVPVAVGMYDPRRWRHHYYTWRGWGGVIMSVTMPVAIVIARPVGAVGTGGNRNDCDQGKHDRQQNTVLFHGSSSFCTNSKTNWIVG